MPNSLPQHDHPVPVVQPRPARLRRRILAVTGLGLAGLLAGLLSGCGSGLTASSASTTGSPASYAQLAGNWGFTAAANSTGARLTLGGSLAVSGSEVTGILHALNPGQCLAPTDLVPMTGSIGNNAQLTLSGASAGGVAVYISGTLSDDRRSLVNPVLSVTGSTCAMPALRQTAAAPRDGGGTSAQQFQPVSGTYSGAFVTADGESFPFTTTVTQLDQPDSSGIYHVQGSAASAGNTCLPATVPATASSLSGGALSTTYTDATGSTSITASGSASADGSTLTLTSWSLSSACGSDTGSAILTRQ